MSKWRFVYLAEIEFPGDSPNEELLKELEKMAYLRGASIKVIDEFYHERKDAPERDGLRRSVYQEAR